MMDFVNDKIKPDRKGKLGFNVEVEYAPVRSNVGQSQGLSQQFSSWTIEVFKAGKELWKFYHSQKDCYVNPSFYNFQGDF